MKTTYFISTNTELRWETDTASGVTYENMLPDSHSLYMIVRPICLGCDHQNWEGNSQVVYSSGGEWGEGEFSRTRWLLLDWLISFCIASIISIPLWLLTLSTSIALSCNQMFPKWSPDVHQQFSCVFFHCRKKILSMFKIPLRQGKVQANVYRPFGKQQRPSTIADKNATFATFQKTQQLVVLILIEP